MAAPMRHGRLRRVLVWTGAVLGVLVLTVAALAWWFVWVPTPDKPVLAVRETSASITVDGRQRRYVTVVPDSLPDGAPLWVVLHGANNTVPQIRAFTGYRLEELAVEKGFAVVYAEGYEKTWHDCRTATPYPARREGVNDVHFVEELVATVTSQNRLDASRVYGFGYSNGSHMLFRMIAESPGTFAGIVANAAELPADGNNECTPWNTPVPVMLVEGTGDPVSPYDGGKAGAFGQNLGLVRSAEESALLLAGVNRVTDGPVRTLVGGDPGEDGSVTLTEYGAGTAHPVRLYTVRGGGHIVPNSVARMPRIMGGSTEHLDSPQAAVDFFEGLPSDSRTREGS
ncbi:polyhydroxybutyrate depolymerase [Actinocorallia herbida]|uniref:Polyhydroxybutyrate depolymerase n=1 Tax=Actinocorallia herbida TaxID=58109 RepID=A0A3N1D2V4_9ACTN|nr:PHB depolymerase family esterase [Actinocorallia herbida]ROO87867.1 polyhydroxybutyrate depolymerase [Actinocorallia herbida]